MARRPPLGADLFNRHFGYELPRIDPVPWPNQTEGGANLDGSFFWLEKAQLDHKNRTGQSIVFEFIVLPSAPSDISEFELKAEVYCREWPDWREQSLPIGLGDRVLQNVVEQTVGPAEEE